MKGHTQKFKRQSWSWDTDTASYDVTLYTSGGVMASVCVVVTHDDGTAKEWARTFKRIDSALAYVDGLR